jgi:Flp pilus assembly protein TadD
MIAERLKQAIADHQSGRSAEAQEGYEFILDAEPNHPDANNLLGLLYYQRGRYEQSLVYAKIALSLRCDAPEYLNNLGLSLKALERLDEAAAAFKRAIDLHPDFPDAHHNWGLLELDRRRYEDALRHFTLCYEHAPQHAHVRNGMALALMRLDRVEDAIPMLDEQLAMWPQDMDTLNNLCVARGMQGDYAAAREVAEEALGRVAIRLNRAHLMLLEGDLEQGFAEHEVRLRRHDYRQKFSVPRWKGEFLPEGGIQLWAEQGFGDAIQFIRYAPMVKERVGQVFLRCGAPLRRLLATVPGIDQVIMPRSSFRSDVHAPLMSMPFIFGTDGDTIPATMPYIAVPPPMDLGVPTSKRKVGLVWAGNPKHARDCNRSRSLTEFAPLASVDNVAFFSLQLGEAATQRRPEGLAMRDIAPRLEDFLDTASALAALDLLITVDTSIVHLAGALSLPAWLIIDNVPDWRWQLNREDSPWYPSVRLFRSDGDYGALFQRIATALEEFATA